MRPAIELEIAGVVVDTGLDLAEAERLGGRFEQAFSLLAERLQTLPTQVRARLHDFAVDRLVIELDDPRVALGPGGAELLADELFRQLLTPIRE